MHAVYYLKLFRLDAALISFVSYLGGAQLAGSLSLKNFFIALIVSLISFNFIYSFNSWADWRVDKINKPWRPIPAGKISPPAALRYSIFLLVLSLLYPLLVFNSPLTLALFLLLPFIGIIYSMPPIRIRRFFIPTVIAVSTLLNIPIMLGYFMNSGDFSIFPFFIVLFAYCLSVIPFKDIGDARGDAKYKIDNFYALFGKNKLIAYSLIGLTLNLCLLFIFSLESNLKFFLLLIIIGTFIINGLFFSLGLRPILLYKTIIYTVIIVGLGFFIYNFCSMRALAANQSPPLIRAL